MAGRAWWLLSLAFLLAGCKPSPQDLAVASVDGTIIAPAVVSRELHGLLWRHGENWAVLSENVRQQRRREALDRCVETLLLDKAAAFSGKLSAAEEKEVEHDFQQFLKQFEATDGWEKRAQWQGLNEAQLRDWLRREFTRTRAVEVWLKKERTKEGGKREDEALAWFQLHRGELRRPATAKVSHIYLTVHDQTKPDRTAEITEVSRKLTTGETTFETLATQYSEDGRSKKVGGLLGWVDEDRIPADLAEQVFKLPIGRPSPPFRTALGWHILVVHERKAARFREFLEVMEEIVARLDQTWREAAVKRLTTELREKAKIEVSAISLAEVE